MPPALESKPVICVSDAIGPFHVSEISLTGTQRPWVLIMASTMGTEYIGVNRRPRHSVV